MIVWNISAMMPYPVMTSENRLVEGIGDNLPLKDNCRQIWADFCDS